MKSDMLMQSPCSILFQISSISYSISQFPHLKIFRLQHPGSGRIRSVLSLPVEQEFGDQDQQQAYGGGAKYLAEEEQCIAELQPFDQYEVKMVCEAQQAYVQCIGSPADIPRAGFEVALFRGFLGNDEVKQVGAYISDKHAGGGMQTGRAGEKIEREAKQEADDQQQEAVDGKRQPEQVQEIHIRYYEPVQRRHLVQYHHLEQDEQDETDNIFQQAAHGFLGCMDSSCTCSAYRTFSIRYTYWILKKLVAVFTFSV